MLLRNARLVRGESNVDDAMVASGDKSQLGINDSSTNDILYASWGRNSVSAGNPGAVA